MTKVLVVVFATLWTADLVLLFLPGRGGYASNDKARVNSVHGRAGGISQRGNKTKAILVKEKFINDFEKSYEYEKEVQTEVTKTAALTI